MAERDDSRRLTVVVTRQSVYKQADNHVCVCEAK